MEFSRIIALTYYHKRWCEDVHVEHLRTIVGFRELTLE